MTQFKSCGPTAHRIADRIAAEHGFTIDDIRGPSQRGDVVRVRFAIAGALAKEGYARTEIAALINRSYSHVLYAIRACDGRRRVWKPRLDKGQKRKEAELTRLTARLQWSRGPDRTKAILEGRDPATQADVAAWNNLGRAHERRAGL